MPRYALVALCLAVSLVVAQPDALAADSTIAGNFDVAFQGAVHDGSNTTFTYCVTGIPGTGFRALSNWMVDLDTNCLSASELVTCTPGPCFYQENDPHFGLTGIKFDDTSVEAGETKCYSFTLAKDWSPFLGIAAVGLKAANAQFQGQVTGPVCPSCDLSMVVTPEPGTNPLITVDIHHNRPPTVSTALDLTILNASGARVRRWKSAPLTFSFNDHVQVTTRVPGARLPAGSYTLSIGLTGMGRWASRATTFEQP